LPRIQYKDIEIGEKRQGIISRVNALIRQYRDQGYVLTLRQLYYQFVARGWIANSQKEYKRLGDIINDGRLAGLIDWYAIEDRTRSLSGNSHWSGPSAIIRSAADSYHIDKWSDQPCRVEVWVEKDALEGIVGQAASALDVDYFSCRGYTSQTAMWNAGRRLKKYGERGQKVIILHLGDHDPSGIDMSRDIEERLVTFMEEAFWSLTFDRIALNKDQIRKYDPPPNPAKITDSRCAGYVDRFGKDSWELDALEPGVIAGLINDAILSHRDGDKYEAKVQEEEKGRELLTAAARRWDRIADYLDSQGEI
jgi:hypothetical protein